MISVLRHYFQFQFFHFLASFCRENKPLCFTLLHFTSLNRLRLLSFLFRISLIPGFNHPSALNCELRSFRLTELYVTVAPSWYTQLDREGWWFVPMSGNISARNFFNLEILLGLSLLLLIRISHGYTNPVDVEAINGLYIALGLPSLPGWIAYGGDPCGGNWQGVDCGGGTNINSIKLIGANLGGELGDGLDGFSSINDITLSNNLIGGSIPSNLPATLINLFLSHNKFNGTIPTSLSTLTHLTAMSLNDNGLTGEIPDAFENLSVLSNLDLSNNSLSGHLPASMQNLSSLKTLDLQNNQLSGTLEALQDLSLKDLDIDNNLFSGPIPPQLQNLSNFRNDGNLFNSSIISPVAPPSSGTPPPTPPFFPGPTFGQVPPSPAPGRQPPRQADAPITIENNHLRSSSPRRVVGISIAAVFSCLVLLMAILLLLPRCLMLRSKSHRTLKRHEIAPYSGTRERDVGQMIWSSRDDQKAPTMHLAWTKDENQKVPVAGIPKSWNEDANKQNKREPKTNESQIDFISFDMDILPPPPPPPPLSLPDQVIVSPITEAEGASTKSLPEIKTSARPFTIASLQQYTNNFSHDILVGGGMLGNVYRAQLPDGRLLAVKKLDKRVANQLKDDAFIDLINILDKIRHSNVVELLGYCSEDSQRLLIYKFCVNGTLHDALHSDEEHKRKLSWNIRLKIALGAARALAYLHEACEPPIIHRNFKSANILFDDDFSTLVSDCGMAPLMMSGSVSQLSGRLLTTYGYGAPEYELGIYTTKSDVYSFGVVMLELLTGRMSHDRSRARAREEHNLVRWADPQLHDINSLSKMVDPDLVGRYPVKSLSYFADIISPCILPEPEFRPMMSEVVGGLLQLIRRESMSSSEAE